MISKIFIILNELKMGLFTFNVRNVRIYSIVFGKRNKEEEFSWIWVSLKENLADMQLNAYATKSILGEAL